jgi:cell division protein FtsZ
MTIMPFQASANYSPARKPEPGPELPAREHLNSQPVLKVLGLGGGGCNAVNRMIELGLGGIEFIAANTDFQAMQNCLAPVKIQLGPKVTRGLGAGGKPEIGRAAAEESEREIAAALAGADMVFLTAGMGGGTGTGSIAVAAGAARSVGAVTIAIVTTPFSFEMGRRQRNANTGLADLRPHTNTLIAIPNDRLLHVAPRNLPLEVAFRLADDVLRQAVQGVTELITEPGLINIDFAHIRRLMELGGGAIMSIGQGQGEGKARMAIEQALHHPLLESVSLESAAGVIANFTGGNDLTLLEVSEVLTELQGQISPQAEIVLGVTHDANMADRAQVILVVTGLGATPLEEVLPGAVAFSQAPRPVPAPAHPAPAGPALTPAPRQAPADPPALDRFQASSGPYLPTGEAVPMPVAQPTAHSATYLSANDLDVPAFLRKRMAKG